MSRTDHHRPWRIRAADGGARAYISHDNIVHSCTGRCGPRCGWTMPHQVLCSPPADFIHAVWYGPERARERIELGRMAREWNAHGNLADGDFANYQHRHIGGWLWI